jgi:hypothetical protein
MPDDPTFDLAKLDSCLGVRPGMTRAEVDEALKRQGLEAEEDDPHTLYVAENEWEVNLHFATDGTQRLRQMSMDYGDLLWNGQKLNGLRVDDAWRLMGSPGNAVWEKGDRIGDPFPDAQTDTALPPTDEELLNEGTLWLPERNLGLVIGDGEVLGAAWRDSRDLPKHFAGPLTQAQRDLSKKPNLDDYLFQKRTAKSRAEEKKNPARWLQKAVAIAAIAALALVGKKAFEEKRLWSGSPTLQAKFVTVERVTMRQFRDNLPPALSWMFPQPKAVMIEAYRVEFVPPGQETPQQAVLERGELYVPPEKPGDQVPIVHVAGPPPRTLGLRRAQDIAFIEYMPWAIAIGGLWLVLNIALGLLPAIWRAAGGLAKRAASSDVIKDPNRPELR